MERGRRLGSGRVRFGVVEGKRGGDHDTSRSTRKSRALEAREGPPLGDEHLLFRHLSVMRQAGWTACVCDCGSEAAQEWFAGSQRGGRE